MFYSKGFAFIQAVPKQREGVNFDQKGKFGDLRLFEFSDYMGGNMKRCTVPSMLACDA